MGRPGKPEQQAQPGNDSSTSSTPPCAGHSFLAGGGTMGEIIRNYDWGSSVLGPPEGWPPPLKLTVRLLLSTGNPMFIWWGPELIQFYNDAYSRSIGPERHPSAIGQRGRECWDEIWPIIGPQIEQVMAGQGHTWHENHLVPITRHGKREDVYWTYSYTPIDDPTAPYGVGGVLVVCTETTEQVLTEQHTKAAEARWRALFDQAPGFICTLQGPEHVFEFANQRYYDIIGGREIIGKTIREALPEVEGQGFFELLDEVYRTGKAHTGTGTPVTFEDKSGKHTVYVDFVYQPIRDASGQVTGIMANGYDSTERVLTSQSLREEDQRKDEFLAMLAHELRNPLAPIRNASELLLRTTSHDPTLHTVGDMLARQVTQMTRLVDDLLDISRITQGRVTLQREPLDLRETLEMVIESLQDQIEEKQHQVSFNHGCQSVHINGDLTRIIQSFSNVLANAIKYTDSGGRIDLSLREDGDVAIVEITDSGAGISEDMLPKVFDLFVQANRTLDRSQGGLGIGLSVVRRMINMHGGEIAAISKGLGHGSTFRIRLPRIEAPTKVIPVPTQNQVPQRRVLIVDDNVDAAESLAQLLAIKGHETITVYRAQDALQQAQTFKPNVILLDIGLPEMDGYEVARRLRAQGHSGILVAVTGYGQLDDVQRGKEAGFDLHFTKPVAFGDLEGVLSPE